MALNRVVLCIGGNLGDRMANLGETADFVLFNIGDIVQSSGIYESPGWGMENVPDFLNQVLVVETELDPAGLLAEIAELEEFYGRQRIKGKYASREMDVDILFFNDEIIHEENIDIPHPRMHERMFVLKPLSEILPEYIHPELKKTVEQLWKECTDTANVKRID